MKIEFIHSKKVTKGGYWLASYRNPQGKLMLVEGSDFNEAFSGMCEILSAGGDV